MSDAIQYDYGIQFTSGINEYIQNKVKERKEHIIYLSY